MLVVLPGKRPALYKKCSSFSGGNRALWIHSWGGLFPKLNPEGRPPLHMFHASEPPAVPLHSVHLSGLSCGGRGGAWLWSVWMMDIPEPQRQSEGTPLAGTSHHSQIFSQLFLKTAPLTSLRLSVFSHEIETYTHPGFLLTLTLMTAFYLLKHKALCLNYRPSAASRDKRRPLMSCTFQSSLKLPWRQQVFNSGPPRRQSYCPPWGDMPSLLF